MLEFFNAHVKCLISIAKPQALVAALGCPSGLVH